MMPGLVALVASGDEVEVHVTGTQAVDEPAACPRHSIFRIASLTKPIGAVLAMLLVEDGVLDLDDRVDPTCPSSPAGGCCAPSSRSSTTPCRPAGITVHDLLTNRLGFGSLMVAPDCSRSSGPRWSTSCGRWDRRGRRRRTAPTSGSGPSARFR